MVIARQRVGPVAFYLPAGSAPADHAAIDPDRDWQELLRGEDVWITQTFLRLRRAGREVTLVSAPPRSGTLVFHAKHRRDLVHDLRVAPDLILVGIRSDSSDPLFADFEILQNGVFADGVRRYHVPHWPQPGLLPRLEERGAGVRRAAFKGFSANLHPDLASPRWSELLAAEGIAWENDSVAYTADGRQDAPSGWNDFRRIDVVVAVRPSRRDLWTSKPATKLVNAWHAGVPAVLGPERAYRELRRDGLDYIEVASRDEALAAVRRLRDDPALYRAMVDNGRCRAREFSVEAIRRLWEKLLFNVIPDIAASAPTSWERSLPLRARRLLGRFRKLALRDPAR